MAQVKDKKTNTPDKDLKGGKVRPFSKVKVLFEGSKYHKKPYAVEEVHPEFAKKLVSMGKAIIVPDDYALTAEQEAINKEASVITTKKAVKKADAPKKGKETKTDEEIDL